MKNPMKIFRWIVGITGILVALLLIITLLAPRLINLETVQDIIEQKFSEDIDGKIDFTHIDLSFFPRPHALIHNVTFSLPNQITGKMTALQIYPKVLPLIRGSFQLAKLSALEPQYTIRLSERFSIFTGLPFTAVLEEVHELILSFPAFNAPGLSVMLKNGSLTLLREEKRIFGFQNIQAIYKRPSNRTEFNLKCTSNLWQSITIDGWLDAQDFQSSGKIRLARFRPQTLSKYLFPNSTLKLTDALANLIIDFETDGPAWFHANMEGSVPYLILTHGTKELVIKDNTIKTAIQTKKNTASVRFEELSLNDPRMKWSGTLFIDQDQPQITLDLEGRKINLDAIRNLVLEVSGKTGIVKDVFDIIQGGSIPLITLKSQGHRLPDLVDPENMVIWARMRQGKIFIPPAHLDLDQVEGTVRISNGMLKGHNLKARSGKSYGQNGKLTLGLNENLTPFHLDIKIQADLSQLPPVLERVVEDDDFLSELAFIEKVNGTAIGNLVLGIDTKETDVKVEASEVHLNAIYRRIPFPLKMEGGPFFFDGRHIGLSNFDVGIGKSSFSGSTAKFDWGKANSVTIMSGPTIIFLDELNSWRSTFANFDRLEKLKPIKGTLAFKTLTLKGPILSRKKRQFNLDGNFDTSVLNSKFFPGPIRIDSGQISYQNTRMSLSNFHGRLGKSTFHKLFTKIDWGQGASVEATSKSTSIFLDEIWPWLSAFEKFQKTFQHISTAQGTILLHDFEMKGPIGRPANWRFASTGDMQNIMVKSDFLESPITLTSGKFILTERDYSGVPHNCIKLASMPLTWGESHLLLIGDIIFSTTNTVIDLNISLDSVDWVRVEKILDYAKDKKDISSKITEEAAVRAMLKIKSEKFKYNSYIFQPVHVDVKLTPHEVMVAIEKADLCGVTINGTIKVSDHSVEFYIVPKSQNKQLESTLSCLWSQKASASGKFNLGGEIMAQAKPEATTRFFSGDLDFSADNGRIYRFGLLSKLFAVLNITEIYRGKAPDLVGEGFAYHTMEIKADFKGKKLVMQKCAIDGASMGIACEGDIDLVDNKIDLIILVAPFKTVDRIVKHIPLVSGVLGGKIISIPFRAKGDLDDPVVIPLSPTAVGSGILGIMERTLKLPITIIQPLLPDEKPKNEKQEE
ncbi:MAG: AsmA-like C-terminal domain-containing protein [Desulfobacterales bacterium]|nr:MAG: AsmA-like C-terminal domain-containing protein [Desulfobacterales bacterium]